MVDPDASDVERLKASAGFRLRFALLRAMSILALIYLTNVLINLIEIVVSHKKAGRSAAPTVLDVVLLDRSGISEQLPALLGSVVGVGAITAFLLATARLRYSLRKRSYRRQLDRFRRKMNARLRERWPEMEIDDAVDVPKYVERVLDNDAFQRSKKLEQIKEWFVYDELLMEWAALEIAKNRLKTDLVGSVLASAGVVIVASRLLALLS